jgi:hypothetical protein
MTAAGSRADKDSPVEDREASGRRISGAAASGFAGVLLVACRISGAAVSSKRL